MRRRAGEAETPAPEPASRPRADEAKGMRMAELAARSGVARETIHFYLREGLLPRPAKGGRTVAYYGEPHLERLLLIRRLREEKYLPIAVIRRLLESPAGERDLDVLADVLHIIPADDEAGRPPSPEAARAAAERGLLGPGGAHAGGDPAERRVLEVVEEALALDEVSQRLTLDDLSSCAASLTDMVGHEAALFFDTMFRSGDVRGSIQALRSGRPAVARFIAAYRDLMLRRIVDEVLIGLERGPEAVLRTATVPLSARREEELGVPARRAALAEAFHRSDDEASAARWAWHLFETGAAGELAAVPPDRLPARLRPLVAWGALATGHDGETLAALERAVEAAPDFVLGQILLGEAIVARGLRRRHGGASLLEAGIPALNRVFSVDPERDPEPAARAFGWFHRGRLELALPAVLGRRERGLASLARALQILDDAPDAIEPAARVRLGANARLALARHHAGAGDEARARQLLAAAAAMDPDGAIAQVALGEPHP
jgi:DNA-binding transcriptional MerR regulator